MLKIYGIPNSQPVRAVMWPCLMHGLAFDLQLTSQNKDAKEPAFLADVNPRGTVPAIDDEGVVLWESHAILIYLCEKHGWRDLWPDDLVARAKVNQYLHFHHRNTRELVVHWSRSLWPSVFGKTDPDEGWFRRNTFPGLENGRAVRRQSLGIIEGMLGRSAFLAGDSATLADISAYEELGQNQPKFANCEDYSEYPNIRRWFTAMEELPGHDDVHEIWSLIGDVNRVEGGMRTIARANKQAAQTIRDAVARIGRQGA
tara:strand:+ start:2767 stop:3537 length:771 start_codon:yes stop_codon:yes gene_type:complete